MEKAAERPVPWAERAVGPVREMLSPTLVVLLLLQVGSGLLIAPMLSLFLVYGERVLGLSTGFTGALRVLSVCIGGVVALVGGAVTARLGRKRTFLLAMTALNGCGLLFLVPDPDWMWPLAIYNGVMFGLGSVAGLAYVTDSVRHTSLGLATAAYFITGTLGNALGSAISGWVARDLPNGYQLIGLVCTLGPLPLIAIAAVFLPELPVSAAHTGERVRGGVLALLRRGEIWALLVVRMLPTLYWGVVTFLLPLHLFRLTGSEKTVGFYMGASLIASALGQLVMGRMLDRYGPRWTVPVALSLVAVAAVGKGVFIASVPALVIFGLLGAGSAWAISVTMTSLVRSLSSERTRDTLLGVTHLFWSGGFLAGTVLGAAAGRPGAEPGLAFLASGVGVALSLAAALVVVRAAADRGED